MHVTINLARGSGQRELVEALRAAQAVMPHQRHYLNPLDFLIDLLAQTLQKVLRLIFRSLEKIIHQRVCQMVTRERGADYRAYLQRHLQKLDVWLRITKGWLAVKLLA